MNFWFFLPLLDVLAFLVRASIPEETLNHPLALNREGMTALPGAAVPLAGGEPQNAAQCPPSPGE